MDRRCVRFTLEALAETLRIDGVITQVETNHSSGIVNIFFVGDGSRDLPEGAQVPVVQWKPKKGKS